jgi:hypothetical protein
MSVMAENAPQGRRFVWQRLDLIEVALLDLKRALEIMAEQTIVKANELEQIKYQVGALSEGQVELEKRIDILEKHSSTQSWVFRQLGTIALVISAAYIASILF